MTENTNVATIEAIDTDAFDFADLQELTDDIDTTIMMNCHHSVL